jgi:hypothetical protein
MKSLRWLALLSLAGLAPAQDGVQTETLRVRGNVYLLAGTLGNLTVQVGQDPGTMASCWWIRAPSS